MNRSTKFWQILSVLLIVSCSTDLELSFNIDLSSPFQLTLNSLNSQTGLTNSEYFQLEIDSSEWNSLVEWTHKNKKKGWQWSPASFIGNAYVIQGDLRLMHNKTTNIVVIAFNDEKGNPKQYIKKTNEGEFAFLYEIK